MHNRPTARSIHWFRRDLRLADNPPLFAAAQQGALLPLYILDDTAERPLGAASRWWLQESLKALDDELGGALLLLRGDPLSLIPELAALSGATQVSWQQSGEPQGMQQDQRLRQRLERNGVRVEAAPDPLEAQALQLRTEQGLPFRVFTPFLKALVRQLDVPEPLPKPDIKSVRPDPDTIPDHWRWTLPKAPNWSQSLAEHWVAGRKGAQAQLDRFLEAGADHYQEGRDLMAQKGTSSLSPYLAFGELSAAEVWHSVAAAADGPAFRRQLGWRLFNRSLLYHYPHMTRENLKPAFDAMPWQDNPEALAAWQRGQTGIPLVDAGMRELWQSGWMHNRTRMVTASFLTKNLLIDWRLGEAWFWDTLVDADLAQNTANWQWVAGSGMDAAPYFRVFNPVRQGTRFDAEGAYVKRWVPELAPLPAAQVHSPWDLPTLLQSAEGARPQSGYPAPLVDLPATANRAKAVYDSHIKAQPDPA